MTDMEYIYFNTCHKHLAREAAKEFLSHFTLKNPTLRCQECYHFCHLKSNPQLSFTKGSLQGIQNTLNKYEVGTIQEGIRLYQFPVSLKGYKILTSEDDSQSEITEEEYQKLLSSKSSTNYQISWESVRDREVWYKGNPPIAETYLYDIFITIQIPKRYEYQDPSSSEAREIILNDIKSKRKIYLCRMYRAYLYLKIDSSECSKCRCLVCSDLEFNDKVYQSITNHKDQFNQNNPPSKQWYQHFLKTFSNLDPSKDPKTICLICGGKHHHEYYHWNDYGLDNQNLFILKLAIFYYADPDLNKCFQLEYPIQSKNKPQTVTNGYYQIESFSPRCGHCCCLNCLLQLNHLNLFHKWLYQILNLKSYIKYILYYRSENQIFSNFVINLRKSFPSNLNITFSNNPDDFQLSSLF